MMVKRLVKVILLSSLMAAVLLMPSPLVLKGTSSNKIFFVSDREQADNYDIYSMDSNGANITRLTTNESIDNHPDISPDGTVIVFSSNRNVGGKNPEGDFELFLANPNDIDGTAVQLTSNDYADRHPHFSPDGKIIGFDAKFMTIRLNEPISDQCSIPTPPDMLPKFTYRHEGARVIYTKSGGKFAPPSSSSDALNTDTKSLDLKGADSSGQLWPSNTRTYIGHPSFSPDGKKLVFSGSVDGQGNNWEIYTASFNALKKTVSNLRRITNGPTVGNNPIKMSGGGHFTNDGASIIFTSTRNTTGYSHIYRVSATANNVAVGSSQVTQLTTENANDYIPQQLNNGKIAFVSDRPDVDTQACPPSTDLDIIIMNSDGSAPTNLTGNDSADEMFLIGDEVSWFCGLPRNLSECKYYPKIMTLSQLKKMYDDWQTLPLNFPFRDLYSKYKEAIDNYINQHQGYWRARVLQSIINTMHDDAQYDQYKNHPKVVPTLLGLIDNSPPLTPLKKSPGKRRVNSSSAVVFKWSAGRDKDNNKNERFTYDLYLGTNRNPAKIIAADLSKPQYKLKARSKVSIAAKSSGKNVLKQGKTYYWRIVVKDSMGGQKDGPVWSFKTQKKAKSSR